MLLTIKSHTRPSAVLGLEEDSWLAFCFDEACAFIITQLKEDKKPIMRVDNSNNQITYSKPSDLYNKYKQN